MAAQPVVAAEAVARAPRICPPVDAKSACEEISSASDDRFLANRIAKRCPPQVPAAAFLGVYRGPVVDGCV